MAIVLHRSDEDLPRQWTQAFRALGPSPDGTNQITTAIIAPLTTIQGLIDAINNAPRFDSFDQPRNHAAIEALKEAEARGMVNADIAAADTFAGLITLLESGLADTSQKEFQTTHYGGEEVRGNYADLVTVK